MRQTIFIAAILCISQAAAFSVGNQPTEEFNQLNLWYNEGQEFWMSTASSEPQAADAGGFGTGNPGISWSWNMPFAPELYFDMDLDTSVNTEFVLFIGSTNNQRVGLVDTEVTLSHDGTTIATGTSSQDMFANGEYAEITISAATLVDTVPAGSSLELNIDVSGPFQGIFLRHGDESRQSRVIIPVVGGELLLPDPPGELLPDQNATVDATSLNMDFVYDAEQYEFGATQTWNYNWVNENPTGNFSYGGNITQGSVHFLVTDEFGDAMLDARLEAPLDQNQSFEGFEGNWSVQVIFTDFLGDAYLTVDADFEPGIEFNPNTPGLPIVQGEDEFTDGNAADESEGTPPIAIGAIIIGLAAIASRKRS